VTLESEKEQVEGNPTKEGGVYRWDSFSDQPYPIADKKFKRAIRLRAVPANLKMLLVSVLVFPVIFYRSFLMRRVNTHQRLDKRIGLCINLDKEPEKTIAWIEELGVSNLSIRIPLSDISNIKRYKQFAKQFSGRDILFVVLQDREHIENHQLLVESLRLVFSELGELSNIFQIGNAVNRTKWGFVSVDEYLDFFASAKSLRDESFPGLKLLGSSVIDFEIYALLRSLWHKKNAHYDGVSALLYVDRRGAPENKQFVFDLIAKINFFWAAVLSSKNTEDKLLITEANWPIEHTKPYAPALGDVWVSEEDYANFMLRYFFLALANGNIECVYWHQLVAPGYGLIDNRDGQFRKRKAFYMLQCLLGFCRNARIVDVEKEDSVYTLFFKTAFNQEFRVVWSFGEEVSLEIPEGMNAFDSLGEMLSFESNKIKIGGEPVYLTSSTSLFH
jgi:hypothetical protein